MTESKKSANPFVNMANEAKKQKNTPFITGRAPNQPKAPKPNTKGFGGASVMRRSARGG